MALSVKPGTSQNNDNGGRDAQKEALQRTPSATPHNQPFPTLALAVLGVVYGDIGTSPIYALRECFNGKHPIAVTPDNVLGILSLIFWTLILVVSAHRNFKRPLGRPSHACVGGRCRSGGLGTGAWALPCPDSAGTRRFAWSSFGLDIRVDPESSGVESTGSTGQRSATSAAAGERCPFYVSGVRGVYGTAGAAQEAKSCPASRARPLGGGCGSRPR